jgi:hypothetical protein
MRTFVTFILRLWVDPQAVDQPWEGQAECVTTGEQVHVHSPENVLDFIKSQTIPRAKESSVQKRGGQNNER